MTRSRSLVLLGALGSASTLLYVWMALAGDLRNRPETILVCFTLHAAVMLAAWFVVRQGHGGTATVALAAALVFRVVASLGPPALSDDVYRYVWDGRVQAHGVHPYRFAPADPQLALLRDNVWERVNHPDLRTIYPPTAQIVFFGLASTGAGPIGFKLAFGLLDFGVILALRRLLRSRGLPDHRFLLYAWNPLAVMETAGSGHLEPLGVGLTVLAVAWVGGRGRARWGAPAALGAAVQAKLLPVVLVPALLRRTGLAGGVLLAGTILVLAAPYALTGPAMGSGLFAYAGHWERNAVVFPAVRSAIDATGLDRVAERGLEAARSSLEGVGISWSVLRRMAWPGSLARAVVALAALGWVAWISWKVRPGPVVEALWVLGGVLLLSPTVHPWYLLWVLPFAAALASPGWLLLCGTVCLGYTGREGDVAWVVRALEYGPPLVLLAWEAKRALLVRRND